MSHLKRFYCESIPVPRDKLTLDSTQSHHLKNTLRLRLHSVIEIFNNHNESYLAEVSLIPSKGGVELKILSKTAPVTSFPVPNITLACAIAKGNRMDWLIEKTAEIGLTKLIPIITDRTVVKPYGHAPLERTIIRDKDKYTGPHPVQELVPLEAKPREDKNLSESHTSHSKNASNGLRSISVLQPLSNGLRSPENLLLHTKKMERWHKLAISAAKQTGQNSILDIAQPILFNSLGNLIKDFSLSLIAVPNADKYLPEILESSDVYRETGKILYLIGPEGDFTPAETEQAINWGVKPVRLPVNSILRVETAAVTMLAMLLYQYYKSYASVKKT